MHINLALQGILKWYDKQRLKKSKNQQEGSGKSLFMRGLYRQIRRKKELIYLTEEICCFPLLWEYNRNV